MTQPIAGLSLFALMAISCPNTVLAQLPTLQQSQAQVPISSQSGLPPTAYIIGGGDRLFIDVFQVKEYSGEYQVPADGVLYLPLIGGISVRNLTLVEATNAISAAYNRFLKRPIITVRLLSPRPLNIFVSGEVNRPGSFTLGLIGGAGDNPGVQYPTVTLAIQQAGGVTLAADISQVEVRRRQSGGGSDQVFTVNLRDLLRVGDRTQDLTLRDGDTIYIPTTTNVNLQDTRQLATVAFGADLTKPRTVAVVGEVKRPGSYNLIGAATEVGATGVSGGLPTLTRALQQAQGIKPLADIRRIEIRRLTKTGSEQIINVNLWQLLQTGDISQDVILQEGDTVIVPRAIAVNAAEAVELAEARFSPDTVNVSVVGEVKAPATIQVRPNTTLNQALLTAGGFNGSRAQRSTVELIRLNPDGTVSRRDVPVNFTQAVNEQSNPILRDNDIIVVSRSAIANITDTVGLIFSPAAATFTVLSILGIK
ncbi:MAG TPA: SLBB domain-containing protein [Coleofasciculaceae cyanobacterium]